MTILSRRQRLEGISNLLQIANDDILFEIFIRIPDCRSAILCSSVSKRFHSLISNTRFILRFVSQHHQHQARCPPPYTIIFRKNVRFDFGTILEFQPVCKLFSEESMLLHGKSRINSSYLDFLPTRMVVRASCDDLLLLTADGLTRWPSAFYICNPVTKKFYALTQNDWLSSYGYALVRIPESECDFKVLLFHTPRRPVNGGPDTFQDVSIYCSKLGKWESKSFRHPQQGMLTCNYSADIFMCKGILYWLENGQSAESVLAFDLSRFQFTIVDFPDDFGWVGSRRLSVRKCIGTVGGEMRLVQVWVAPSRRCVNLKVWRLLDTNPSSWVLLHEKRYPRAPNEARFLNFFVHPIDGDKILMVWGKHVFQYDLTRKDTYEKIAELHDPCRDIDHLERLMAFPLVHPAWPTPLPSRSFSV